MSFRRGHLAVGFALLLLLLAGLLPGLLVAGIDPESNTDGYDPVAANNNINEARRRNAVSRQIELNYQMLWNGGGWFPASEPVRQPIGHESKQIGPNRWLYRPIYPEDVAQPVETLPTDELLPDPTQGPLLVPPTGPSPSKPPAALLPSPVGPPAPSATPSRPKSQQVAPPAPAGAQPNDYIPPRSSSRKPRARGPRAF